MTRGKLLSYLNEKYGMNIGERLRKLDEEYNELKEIVMEEMKNDDYSHRHCIDFVRRFKDELADVNILIFHIAGILNTSQTKLLEYAYKKIKGMEVDPNFMRYHPHEDKS